MTNIYLPPDGKNTLNVERLNDLADFIERLPHVPGQRASADGVLVPNFEKMAKGCNPEEPVRAFTMASFQTIFRDWSSPALPACGTACCLAGWTVQVYGVDNRRVIHGKIEDVSPLTSWVVDAGLLLGLDRGQALQLFIPSGRSLSLITPLEAATCLRVLADTGRVDWKNARKIVREIKAAEKAMGTSV